MLGEKLVTIEQSALGWRWSERAKKYDSYMAMMQDRLMEKEKLKMAQKQASLGAYMQDKALRALKVMPVTSVSEAAVLAKEGVKIERLARGEKTSDTGGGVNLVWSGPMPPWFGHNQVVPNPPADREPVTIESTEIKDKEK